MMSDRKIRMVETQTPPFTAVVIVKSHDIDATWALAKAEAMLMEQIRAQVGLAVGNLEILKKLGVYTVDHEASTGRYIHTVDAPDGITFQAVEEVPNWWEAEDTFPIYRVPEGNGLTIALLPTVTRDAWRKSAWPDRPHP